MAIITKELNAFLDKSNDVIWQLSHARVTETEQWSEQLSEGSSNYASLDAHLSYQRNMEVANQINELRSLAEKINTLLHIHRHLIEGCKVKKLNINFDGEAIKQSEDAEWECNFTNVFLPGKSSYATSEAITNTSDRIKIVEQQALDLYNYLNPDNPRENPSCCRECIIL